MKDRKANIGSLSNMAKKVRQAKSTAATKAPLARARARESQKVFKSAETVEDSSSDSGTSSDGSSDSDADLDAARAKFLANKVAKQNKGVEVKINGAKSSTPTKPTPNGGTMNGGTPTSAQKPIEEATSDSESETSDSDSSESSSKPTSNLAANQPQANASKTKSDSSSESTSESGSSSEDEEISNAGAKVNPRSQVINGKESSSEESDSGSESDDEGEGGNMTVTRANGEGTARDSSSQLSRPPWLNNSEFMLRKASSDNPGKEVADFFNNANLEGKQVWYFTAPASLPITVLKDMEIDLAKATQGGALLTHKGDNYGLDLESYATNTQIQLLIPSRGGDKYAALNRGIDSTVHLRRMAKFGPGGEANATATEDYAPVPKSIREQPEGLKVRYTPIGVPNPPVPRAAVSRTTSSTPVYAHSSQSNSQNRQQLPSSSESESESDSDEEMTTAPTLAQLTKPAKLGITNGVKRKQPGDEDQASHTVRSSTTADKPAKRLKSAQASKAKALTPSPNGTSQQSSIAKPISIESPDQAAMLHATPSKQPSKDKEKHKKDKTPKVVSTPKRTPVPPPTYPGMKR